MDNLKELLQNIKINFKINLNNNFILKIMMIQKNNNIIII